MGKKNLKPQQQQPVIRLTSAKSIKNGLAEEKLTQCEMDLCGAMASYLLPCICSFDGDDAE